MNSWQTKKQKLYKKYSFTNFREAFKFMSLVAETAELHNHHPDWRNNYNVVEIWLSTHSAGDQITEADQNFVEAIDNIYETTQKLKSDNSEDKITTIITDKEKQYSLYTDGGSRGNPGPSAGAYVILDETGKPVQKSGYYIGITTNNQAEYQALIEGLKQAENLGIARLAVFMDSLLVVNQLKSIYKVKNRELIPTYRIAVELSKKFKQISFNHVPREQNKIADTEVNRILDEQK